MARCLSAVADRVEGRLYGADAGFGVVSTDTRSLVPGALFVAIRGDRFDGNDYVATAAERGAAGALVERYQDMPLPQIKVSDTRLAFGAMARAWRENFTIPVVAVTGSAGKTTVKELAASILGQSLQTCVTEGNLNNDIGVPLSLMRLGAEDEAMVVELGANHAGEIANLGGLVEPTVAVITNAGAAHLEGFGSLDGVARAKGELIDCLPVDGVAILNADDRYFSEWRERAGSRTVISFGVSDAADCQLQSAPVNIGTGSRLEMRLPDTSVRTVELPLLGRANALNALAAAAATWAAGAGVDDICTGLGKASAVRGRMQQLPGINGACLIDDSYNANPTAAKAALDYLAACGGSRLFVLGDMLELGDEAIALHRELGDYARGRCDRLVAVGELAAEAAAGFGRDATAVDDIDSAVAALRDELDESTTVLVKASRSMGLDRLVTALAATAEGESC